LKTLRLQSPSIADQRPRPPPTSRTEQLIAEAPLPIETAAAEEDGPIVLFSSTFNCEI